jgi:hypothetical protein
MEGILLREDTTVDLKGIVGRDLTNLKLSHAVFLLSFKQERLKVYFFDPGNQMVDQFIATILRHLIYSLIICAIINKTLYQPVK